MFKELFTESFEETQYTISKEFSDDEYDKFISYVQEITKSLDFDSWEEDDGSYVLEPEDAKTDKAIVHALKKMKIKYKESKSTSELEGLSDDEIIEFIFAKQIGYNASSIRAKDLSYKFDASNGSIWNDSDVADFSKSSDYYGLSYKELSALLKKSKATKSSRRV